MEKILGMLAIFLLTAASPPPVKPQQSAIPVDIQQDTTQLTKEQADSLLQLPPLQDTTFVPRAPAMINFYKAHADKTNSLMAWSVTYFQPGVYDIWWHEIAACLKLKLPPDYKLTQFVMINQEVFIAPENMPKTPRDKYNFSWAVTYQESNQIFVGISSVFRKSIITHEMAHMLIHWNKVDVTGLGKEHPTNIFDGHCGITTTNT